MAVLVYTTFCLPGLSLIIQNSLSLSILTAIFRSEPGLASFIGTKDDGSCSDNWSYKTCKAPVKSSPPTNQHPAFYRLDALPVTQPCQSTEGIQKGSL